MLVYHAVFAMLPISSVPGAPPDDQLTVAATLRSQLIAVPGRLVNRAGTPVLRGPLHWPWQHRFDRALERSGRYPPSPRADPPAAWRPAPSHTQTLTNRPSPKTLDHPRPFTAAGTALSPLARSSVSKSVGKLGRCIQAKAQAHRMGGKVSGRVLSHAAAGP